MQHKITTGIRPQYLAIFVFSLFFHTGYSEVYKVVDPETGRITYTDNPPPKSVTSDKLDVPKVNTQPAVTAPTDTDQQNSSDQPEEVEYETLTILQPKHNETIPPGQLDVVVQVRSRPALQDGHRIQVLMNGKVASTRASTTSIVLSDLIRGSHQIKAQIIDADGQVKKSSKSLTIHVKRASVNF